MTPTEEGRWHLDRKVPIALIFTVAVQTGLGIWWLASLGERVNTLEKAAAVAAAAAPTSADRLTRVEVKVDTALEGITEIKRLIQRPQ